MSDGRVEFHLDGAPVSVPAEGLTLLEALRDHLGVTSVKDGCSPQGQCGCCTVWVDGAPRVACVTPCARVAGREVTTVAGLADAQEWADRLCTTGGSQCGFCTPGIVMRLAAIEPARRTPATVGQALLAHVCRCTGWTSIVDAACGRDASPTDRDLEAAARRAELEGGAAQMVGPQVALGAGGFAADTAPPDALVAVRAEDGRWVVAERHADARRAAALVPGRRTTEPLTWPVDVPEGDWVRTLQTTWVEPGYLELDAAWCRPGGEPVGPLCNGGAFGAKRSSLVAAAARQLADEHGRPVLAVLSRQDVVRLGPKRPPLGIGVRADGSGVVRVARTPGIAAAIASVAPGLAVEEIDVPGPPTSVSVRGAGWAEALAVLASLGSQDAWVLAPGGGRARAIVTDDAVRVQVSCGSVLDEVVLRSYCTGAAHMALGWVRSEAITVSADGEPLDLTMRSFGVLRAVDTPVIEVTVLDDGTAPVNGSDAVFAAVAAAAWRHGGFAPRWPTMRT